MNGLTKQEQNIANLYHPFNRKFVRAIIRITKKMDIDLKFLHHITPNGETLSIRHGDWFEIQVRMQEANNCYFGDIRVDTRIEYGIEKRIYNLFVKIRNQISDLAFEIIGDK